MRKPKAKGTDRCVDCGFEFDDNVQGGRLRCHGCRLESQRKRANTTGARYRAAKKKAIGKLNDS